VRSRKHWRVSATDTSSGSQASSSTYAYTPQQISIASNHSVRCLYFKLPFARSVLRSACYAVTPGLQDNVLLEWTLMAELLEAGRLRAVVPIMIGELSFADASGVGGSCGGNALMGELFHSRAYGDLSSAQHKRVIARAAEVLAELGVVPTQVLNTRTIKEVVGVVLQHLGIAAHDFFPNPQTTPASSRTAVADSEPSARPVAVAVRAGRQHGWEAGIRSLVGAARKRLMTVLERVLQREEDASAAAISKSASTPLSAAVMEASAGHDFSEESRPPPVSAASVPAQAVAVTVTDGSAESSTTVTAGWAEAEIARLKSELEAERARTMQVRLEAERALMRAEAKADAERALAAKALADAETERAKAVEAKLAQAQSSCCCIF
jgi:hypothetical protein